MAIPIAAGLLLLVSWRALSIGPLPPSLTIPVSPIVVGREGLLLRPFTVDDGRWRLPFALDDVDPRFIAMLLAWEDQRFYHHPGVDPLAVLRAARQVLAEGRIVSGASTLTMQLVRLLDGEPTRSLAGKIEQAQKALALERRADKATILTAYLHRAPYGGNLEGVRSASLAYFGKEPRRLSVAEAALLVAIPQAPEARRPDRRPHAARQARDRVLARAVARGLISPAEAAGAARTPIPIRRRPFPRHAAHAALRAWRATPGRNRIELTIDRHLQGRLEALAVERVAAIGPHASLALLVAEHRSGAILATVGSPDPLATARHGFIDMTRAVRSPGSTLKPLIYGLGFELGLAHPESLIEDRPRAFSGYIPSNFDRAFVGTVTVREALQRSLNVPAVTVLEAIGPARLLARLRCAGAKPVLAGPSPPGLAIGLGGVGLTLTDLVHLYAAIARGGEALALRIRSDQPVGPHGCRVIDAHAAWHVSDILAGAPAPLNTSPGDLAYKTGTSYGHRDAWAIGYDGRFVIGVWVGRPDGLPIPALTGMADAAPILIAAFGHLGGAAPFSAPPASTLIATTDELPRPLRHVGNASGLTSAAVPPPEIAYPPDGARVAVGLSRDVPAARIILKARHGTPPLTWYVNGAPIAHAPYGRPSAWRPDGPGFATIAVVDSHGQSSRVSVMVE